jgi:fido (protein-threonine AMPylation protein)
VASRTANAARTRIGECDDPHQLDRWMRRATAADSVEDLVDPETGVLRNRLGCIDRERLAQAEADLSYAA